MLQVRRNELQPIDDGFGQNAAGPSLEERFETYWGFVRRQYPIMALVFFSVILLGAIYLFTATPKYTGVADLIIDSKRSPLFQQQSIGSDPVTVDSSMVDSQVEILKSENVALAVVRNLRLTEDPEFVGSSSGLLGTIIELMSSLFGGDPSSQDELTRRAVMRFQSQLTIKRLTTTYVIEISFQSTSAAKAAAIANGIADAYVVDALEAKYQTSRRAGTWLQDRLKELRTQASDADRAVVAYKASNNIIDTGGRLMNEQQLAELNSSLTAARGQASDAQARMERIYSILKRGKDGAVLDAAATVTDTLHNEVITRLRSQYLDLAAREADWSAKYGTNHLAAVNLRAQMREIGRSIQDELQRIAETYKSDFEIAKNRVDAVQKQLDGLISQYYSTNQSQIVLRDLDSTAQTYRALSDNFLQLFMQSVQQQSFPITESRLITSATPPLSKSSPKALIVFAVTFVLGAVLAVGAALLRDLSDRVFRTANQVESRLKVTCLAVLPLLKKTPKRDVPVQLGQDLVATRTLSFETGLASQIVQDPFSRFAESVRSIKVANDLSDPKRTSKSVGITSSLPNEGKTTVASSLALVMATSGRRTILVDCDLRNPSITRTLAPGAEFGLLQVISGEKSLEEVLWTDPKSGLSMLPVVLENRIANTSDVLSSPRMHKLFEVLHERYDYIVVDLPPLAPIIDVRTTTALVHSYVHVIEWGATKFNMVERVLNEVPELYDRLLGVVLNKANLSVLSRYENFQGNYYYNRYYNRYGYGE